MIALAEKKNRRGKPELLWINVIMRKQPDLFPVLLGDKGPCLKNRIPVRIQHTSLSHKRMHIENDSCKLFMLVIFMVHVCCRWVGLCDCFSPTTACKVFPGYTEADSTRKDLQFRFSFSNLSPKYSAVVLAIEVHPQTVMES